MSAAAIAAVNCVALVNVVVFATPPNFTTAPETKPVPFTVRVKAALPAVVLDGESDVIAKFEVLLIVKVWAFDVPPLGAGFVTVTLAVPAVAISAARIAAVTCVLLTNVVVRLAPLNWTVAPLTKPVPFTVSVKAALPAVALAGESEVIVRFEGLLIVKV
jgi:hypothetical protein